ncbi:MAG: methyltransferase [Puniceicoccaceae bacterium]|nr:MAG: methyltransferase [Puniceicoccaceae bacterium]
MRITGGSARGIPVKAPARGNVRPATDRLREAVFSSLGPLAANSVVVDLFAGTGAYGLEALSRGADRVCWVEKSPAVIRTLEANLAAVCRAIARPAETRIRAADALAWQPPPDLRPTLVFADPPYDLLAVAAPRLFANLPIWTDQPSALRLVLEMPGEFEPTAPGWRCLRRLGKGRGQPTAGIFQPEPG